MFEKVVGLLFAGLNSAVYGARVVQELPSSCVNLPDGDHYIQPLTTSQLREQIFDDERIAHPVHATCSNGYMIIDPIKDENMQNYFTSYHEYHYAFGGPDLDDHVTWREWWAPSRYDTKLYLDLHKDSQNEEEVYGSQFTISNDCNVCEDEELQTYPKATAFYMTGDIFGCNWANKNLCGFDLDTLECQICDNDFFNSDDNEILNDWGSCGHVPISIDHTIYPNHEDCTTNGYMMLPSIGITSTEAHNKYCVCYKPSELMSDYSETQSKDFDFSTELENELDTLTDIFDNDVQRIVHLTQSDFKDGTLRITRPGKYSLSQDIILDFNSPNDNKLKKEINTNEDKNELFDYSDYSVNGDDNAWFPKEEQKSDYPGARELDGWYWLGFYAGITIEADDVILDLNEHSIGMSYGFYLQQRWFVTILIANKPFIDTQGPTWTGAGFQPSQRALIKNGIIGLSSHHGILALNATDCILQDLQIRDFETHGLAVNEFHNLKLTNIEIGPSSRYVYLNGMYNLARMQLPILRNALEEYRDETIEFKIPPENSNIYTFEELYDNLILQMDLAFNYVYYGITYNENDELYDEFIDAFNTFVNPSGISPHGVVYGAVFRPRGASIQNFGRLLSEETKSSDLYINNLEIHDLSVDVVEYFAMRGKKERWIRDMINGVVPFQYSTIGFEDDLDNLRYKGSVWTNIVLALKKFSVSWWELGRMSMGDEILTWAESGERLGAFYTTSGFDQSRYCNMDSLGHLVKGMLGIRMEWVENVFANNINIHDLFSLSKKGNDKLCGNYVGTGHPVQSTYENPGYGGVNTYGLLMYHVTNTLYDGVKISNLVSYNGPTMGIKNFRGSTDEDISSDQIDPQVLLKNVELNNFFAGIELKGDDGKEPNWPNAAARACAIIEDEESYISEDNGNNPQSSCMFGKAVCMCGGSTCFGDTGTCDDIPSITTPYDIVHLKVGQFDVESNDEYVPLSIENKDRPNTLSELMENEPQRIDSNDDDDESLGLLKPMKMKMGGLKPIDNDIDDDTIDIASISEAVVLKGDNHYGDTVSLLDKKLTWIGISIFVIFLSLLILVGFTKWQVKSREDVKYYRISDEGYIPVSVSYS